MRKLTIGVVGTSKKKDERRVPIHPEHLPRLPEHLRRQLIFEEGYGVPFGISDLEIAAQVGGIATRSELLADTAAKKAGNIKDDINASTEDRFDIISQECLGKYCR